MLRASNIPPLLSRITGDGIHTALLVTSDGELLGSATTRQDLSFVSDDNIASIGSLIAEVAADYKRAGNDLAALDGKSSISASEKNPTTASARSVGGTTRSTNGVGHPNTSAVPALKCLLVEFEQGIAGVASTGSYAGCLVIALAESTVEVGLIRARVMTLASYVGEALTQLAEPP